MWRLNNMLLNNQWVTEEIKEEIKNTQRQNENGNTRIQNLWDAAKAVLRGKFTAIQTYLRNQEKSQINNQTRHLKQLEKENKQNLKLVERKSRKDQSRDRLREQQKKINETKSQYSKNINKIDTPLVRLIMKKKGAGLNQ